MTIKKRIYINILVFGILFVFVVALVIFPQIKKLSLISENFVLQKNILNLLESQMEDLETFQQNYLLHKHTLEKIENSFVEPKEPINFIEFLEKEAQNSELEINISPLSVTPSEIDLWKNTGFKIKIAGTFSNSLRFLTRVEASPFLIEIFQFNIQRINEKTNLKEFENLALGDVICDISFKTFSGESLEG